MKVRKAVIPRLASGPALPATKAQPKEMLPLVDKPSIQYVIEEAVASGIEDILIVTGRGKQAIEDHFDRSVELEQLLTDKGDEDKLELVRPSPTWPRSTTSARRPRSASATPSAWPSSTSATSRSPSCWATTSSTRARSCWPT